MDAALDILGRPLKVKDRVAYATVNYGKPVQHVGVITEIKYDAIGRCTWHTIRTALHNSKLSVKRTGDELILVEAWPL